MLRAGPPPNTREREYTHLAPPGLNAKTPPPISEQRGPHDASTHGRGQHGARFYFKEAMMKPTFASA